MLKSSNMPVMPVLVSENFDSLSFLEEDCILQQGLKSKNTAVLELISRNPYAVGWAGDYLVSHFLENWETSRIEVEVNVRPSTRAFIRACRFPEVFAEQAIHCEAWDLAELLILLMMERGFDVSDVLALVAENESSAYTNAGLRARYATNAAPALRAAK
jgi:hypothetical protein